MAMLYGYPNVEYEGISWKEQYLAVQILIWEIIMHYRESVPPYSRTSNKLIDEMVFTDWPNVKPLTEKIAQRMANHGKIPSFTTDKTDRAYDKDYTIVLKMNEDTGLYEGEVEDTNGVLNDFNFNFDSIEGVTFTKEGNKIKISTAREDLGTQLVEGESTTYMDKDSASVLIWDEGNDKHPTLGDQKGQSQASLKATVDPIPVYFTLAQEDVEVPPPGGLGVLKTAEDGRVSGIPFTVTNNETGDSFTLFTDETGYLSLYH